MVNIPDATLNIREHVPLKLWNLSNGLQHHIPQARNLRT